FLSSASAMPMLRGPLVAYAPEDEGGSGADDGGEGGDVEHDDDADDQTGGGDDDQDDDEEREEGDDGAAEDLEDVEFEGKQYKLPKEVKRGLLREADYTQKTQALAERAKAFEAEAAKTVERTQALRSEIGRVHACQEQVEKFEALPWEQLRAADPDEYRELRDEFSLARDRLAEAQGTLQSKEAELGQSERQADATRLAEVEATLTRDIPNWGPEVFKELVGLAGEHGISQVELRQASASEWKILHLASLGAKALKSKTSVQRHEKAQSTRPAAQTKGRAPVVGVRDELSTAEWMARRNKTASGR
ncbi:MAG TPA: hypothetical protein PKX06_02940, partial [Phenylobacterium sp.]|nr:hypothetical protein [Phenylobacterium sp.]